MESGRNTAFRNAINGYNKADVKEYIARMAEETVRREDIWDTERNKLLRAEEDEREQREKIEAQRDEMACQLYEAQAAVKEKEAALETEAHVASELKASAAGLSARVHELECALARKSEELSAVEKAVGLRERAGEASDALCDRLHEKVESIMSAAGKSAEEIVTSALARSDEIIAEAEKKAEKIQREAKARSEELAGRAKADYQSIAADYYDEVMLFASEIRDSLSRLMLEIGAKKTDVENKIEYMRASAEPEKLYGTQAKKKEPSGKESKPYPEGEGEDDAVCAMDKKIESFFKNTMQNISHMTRRKK